MSPTHQQALSTLAEIAEDYRTSGMEVVGVGHLGRPQTLRNNLRLQPSDYGVCAFMGSAPGRLPGLQEIVRTVPETLGLLNSMYDLRLALINGGGNWDGAEPNEATGLMGQWAFGATRHNQLARFVITQGLVETEGLPRSPGTTICLKQRADDADDIRLGQRTDGLIYVGDLFLVFPGGMGTLVEKLIAYTSMGINEGFKKKFLVIDPIYQDLTTQSSASFWDLDIRSLAQKHHFGFISDTTAKRVNEHCLVYRPDAVLTPAQVSQEIVSLVLAIRQDAPNFDPRAGYGPLPPTLLNEYMRPLSPSSTIGRIFEDHPIVDRSWGDSIRRLGTGEYMTLTK